MNSPTPTLFASLTGPLLGVYYPLPFADENSARRALNSSGLKRLWCSVYTREQVAEQLDTYGGVQLPDTFARKLDYDSWEVEHHESPAHSR